MSFASRIEKSMKAIQRFDRWCDAHNIVYAKTGYEDLLSNNQDTFKSRIQALQDDGTANRIRYFPDRVVALHAVTLVEVKCSETIERAAYDTYMDLCRVGYRVGIVILHGFILSFCLVEALQLQEPHTNHIPILDKYWLAPRAMPNYAEWKAQHPSASGTTFSAIDFSNTKWTVLA